MKAYEATDQSTPELYLTLLRCFPLHICVTQEMTDYSNIDKGSQCLGSHKFRYAMRVSPEADGVYISTKETSSRSISVGRM